jgi:hypothetical protein
MEADSAKVIDRSVAAAPVARLDNSAGPLTIQHPVAKFLIGTFAVLAAGIIPRLVAALVKPNAGEVVLVGFTDGYVQVMIAFALIVGVTLMIFEWGVPKPPRDSFMAALGIPAVLVGAFNTAVLTRQVDGLGQAVDQALHIGAGELSVPVEPREGPRIEPLTPAPDKSGFLPSHFLVAPAYAQAGGSPHVSQRGPNVGIQYAEPRYYVILSREASEQEARLKARALQRQFPDAEAVKRGHEYVVVESRVPKLPSQALAIAARAKQGNLSPSLAPAQ